MSDKIRADFEADALPYGFDLTLANCGCCVYVEDDTEARWLGYQACVESMQAEQDKRFNEFEHDCQIEVEALQADKDKLEARVKELEDALQTIEQCSHEMHHAYSDPNWFTNGAEGARKHYYSKRDKMQRTIDELLKEVKQNENNT